MPNLFAGLGPALDVIAHEAEILPATGQAVEDLMRPDQEEVYDRIKTRRVITCLMDWSSLRVLEDNL